MDPSDLFFIEMLTRAGAPLVHWLAFGCKVQTRFCGSLARMLSAPKQNEANPNRTVDANDANVIAYHSHLTENEAADQQQFRRQAFLPEDRFAESV
jgi:hypothetical protein